MSIRKNQSGRSIVVVLGIIAVVAVLGYLLFLGFQRESFTGSIVNFSWERSVRVEQLQDVQEEAEILPTGAVVLDQHERIDYELVHDGVRSYKNANFAKDYPKNWYRRGEDVSEAHWMSGDFVVYEPHEPSNTGDSPPTSSPSTYKVDILRPKRQVVVVYTYLIKRWVEVDTAKTSGADQNPFWPMVPQSDTLRVMRNSERERYEVVFSASGDGKTYRMTVPDEQQFVALDANRLYELSNSTLGGLRIEG